jgi:hypothetical protein
MEQFSDQVGTGNRRMFNYTAGSHRKIRAIILLVLFSSLYSCASMHESKDFERHRFSQIEVPYDRTDVIYFDVSVTGIYPDNDPVAESKRMEWLNQWMEQRRLCPSGYEVVSRRNFDYMEDNPAHYDLRYEVECKNEPTS